MIEQAEWFLEALGPLPLMARVAVIGSIPAILTILGSVPIFFGIRLEEKITDAGMGFAAGVMTVASFTSLLLPAIELGGITLSITGFIVGVALVKLLDSLIPHMHITKGYEGIVHPTKLKRAWLIALAMIVHNIPEGMAVGAAATYSIIDGLVLSMAIGLQDVPEGLAVALPIAAATSDKKRAFIIGSLSGIIELFAALVPPLIITAISVMLPFMLALAAGAMIYVVVHEITPDIYGHGHDEPASLGFFLGFIVMLILDSVLG